jgi:hypothetical protein
MWWDLISPLVLRNFMKILATSAIAIFAGDERVESLEESEEFVDIMGDGAIAERRS